MYEPWNHNIHYYGFVMSVLPAGCERALDVGCGEGTLVRELASRVPSVTGIDVSAAIIERARASSVGISNSTYICGDFSTQSFDQPYDFITAVASLHHLDFDAALGRMRQLLRPGGVVAVVGLAKEQSPVDFALAGVAHTASRAYRLRHGWWDSGALLIDPTMTYREVRRRSRHALPGRRYRRHLLYRYSLVWHKPQ